MSGIKEVEKLNQRQIETVKRRNEREVRTINNAHENYKADLKKGHAEEVVEIQKVHHSHLAQEAEKKEKVLAEMRNHLQQTKDLTEKELKNLKDTSSKEKVSIEQKLTHDRERINNENELYLEELNYRFNESSKKIGQEGNNRIEEIKSDMHGKASEQQEFYQNKINTQTQEFNTRFTHDEIKNRQMKDQQDVNFKKERMATNLRQQNEMQKMTTTHTDHIEKRDDQFRKGLKDQDLFFEKKYGGQLQRHTDEFRTLEEKNKKLVDDLKSSLTKEISRTASRNEDPFYKFETLKPELSQFEDRVEVRVKIPEHSKQDIQLTINGKDAIVNFNRRYNDASKTPDGTINKINKVETFSTRLPTSHILDPKSVKSTFDDGVMTYVIKRA